MTKFGINIPIFENNLTDFEDKNDDVSEGLGYVMTFINVRDVVLDDIKADIQGMNERGMSVDHGQGRLKTAEARGFETHSNTNLIEPREYSGIQNTSVL